jgi:hypothetical protein
MNSLDLEGIELGKQLGIVVSSLDELADKVEKMNLILALNENAAWVVINSENEILATLA